MSHLLHADPPRPRHRHTGAAESELADIEVLHSISIALIGEQDRVELCGKIVDAAISITGQIPFVFVSGYGRPSLPAAFDHAELLPKPFDTNQLLDATARLVL
jgi:hypothetical protein